MRQTKDDLGTSQTESLSEVEIRKALLSDAVQHPATIIPLMLFAMSAINLGIWRPILGGPVWSIILLVVSGMVTTGTFLWRYVHYDERYALKTEEVMALLDQRRSESEEGELKRLREDLRAGFANSNSTEGTKALQQLVYVYDRLQSVVERKKATDPLALASVPALAEETYRQGMSILSDSLHLMTAIRSPHNERLERETTTLRTKPARATKKTS